MELKQLEDRKHFTISFLQKKKKTFLEGGVKTFSRYKKDFKKALLFFINKSNNSRPLLDIYH